uniref:Uncharacterized protein n=1 Tax=Candidatus Kentrum eta TaxID=2126337 RepID=A0A450VVL8_9GAMM|nr:MAG: hypothetical protein BECKH772A_GA0070896_105701 [Candidatus Kentron sp. H]VFK08827.1 MAG: hypothetical protein BECKH772C_GA0070978_105511 [Candidatus Kentron sp. H]
MSTDSRNTTTKTLFGKYAQLDFGDVQPATMLGGVVNFQTLQQTPGLGGLKSLVQGSRNVGIQVIPHQNHFFDIRIIKVKQFLDFLSQINGRSCVPDMRL